MLQRVRDSKKSHSFLTLTALAGMVSVLIAGSALTNAADDDDDGKKVKAITATIGKAAPNFTLTDQDGKEYSLSDFKGKTVVLEWYNPDCPYVKAAHLKGALADQGNEIDAEKDKVWLAINSGGKGEQGTGIEHNKAMAKKYGMDYPILFDESGVVGKSYLATKTPHMYVIDGKGILQYSGAIDDDAFARKTEAGKPVVNYVDDAIEAIEAGTKVKTTKVRPYGCGVHYAKSSSDSEKKGRRGGQRKRDQQKDSQSESQTDSEKDRDKDSDGG